MPDSKLLPTTYLAVLSLVATGAKYGYEINNLLRDRGYDNWLDVKFSSVYKALSELEKRNLIQGAKGDEKIQSSKKTYSLTKQGEKILREQIIECLSNPPKRTHLLDLGISSMMQLAKEEAVAALETYLERLEERITFLKSNVHILSDRDLLETMIKGNLMKEGPLMKEEDLENLPLVRALFERPLFTLQAEKQWIEKFLNEISSKDCKIPFKKR
ncbi:MAG: hypothetical protein BAJATHORv1_40280 [Candidatus Thorarchaeota archaeon]|nr:MAG: hypothetical protein BAJATHORv1_40280 [Candidatus Thorarchaeota archaeon]